MCYNKWGFFFNIFSAVKSQKHCPLKDTAQLTNVLTSMRTVEDLLIHHHVMEGVEKITNAKLMVSVRLQQKECPPPDPLTSKNVRLKS